MSKPALAMPSKSAERRNAEGFGQPEPTSVVARLTAISLQKRAYRGRMAQRYLTGVEYPATKEQLIDAALEANAPQEAVERLQQLSHEQYESAAELEAELSEEA
jgi:hypothetical protein